MKGRKGSREYNRFLGIRLKPDLHNQVKTEMSRTGKDISSFIRELLEGYFNKSNSQVKA